MTAKAKKLVQSVLAVLLAAAALRFVLIVIYRARTQPPASAAKESSRAPLDPDYYVVPKKLHAYDLRSARELTRQPVWVKEGYRFTYYPFDRARQRSDFGHEAGVLGPIEQLQVTDVLTEVLPGSHGQRQVVARFDKQGQSYVLPIGSVKDGDYQIYADEIFFIQDPHQLYKHWPAEVWQAIERHEPVKGMNELQISFAVGWGKPEASGDSQIKAVTYPNGGKPLRITYRNGRAVEIAESTAAPGGG